MRSRWYLVVAVGVGWLWSVGLGLAVSADEQPPRVAQARSATDDMTDIIAGPQNPRMTLDINGGIADLSALQVEVIAPPNRSIRIDTVTIGFGLAFDEDVTTGNESFLDELHAHLIVETIDVNGIQDAGEPLLGTQALTDLEDPATLLYVLDPPLAIPAGTTATFLVVVDINRPATRTAGTQVWRQLTMTQLQRAAAWLFIPLTGLVACAYRFHAGSCRIWMAALVLFGCGIVVVGCAGGDSDNELRFVVNLPSNGLHGDGQRLGPERAIAGTTIRLMR